MLAPESSPEPALALARMIAMAVAVYAGIGALVAVTFVAYGVGRVDHEAQRGTFGFRLLILPASAALWPWTLLRMRKANGEPVRERNAHRDGALATSEDTP